MATANSLGELQILAYYRLLVGYFLLVIPFFRVHGRPPAGPGDTLILEVSFSLGRGELPVAFLFCPGPLLGMEKKTNGRDIRVFYI